MKNRISTTPLAAARSMTDEDRRTLEEEYGITPAKSLAFEPKPSMIHVECPPPTTKGLCMRCKNWLSRGGYKSPEWCEKKQKECNWNVQNCWRFKLKQTTI